jgi:serine protease AprX
MRRPGLFIRRAMPLVGAALVLAGVSPPTGPAAASRPDGSQSSKVIVVATQGQSAAANSRVEALGGEVTSDLPLIGGFAAMLPAAAIASVRADPAVRSVTPDAKVQVATARTGGLGTTAAADSEPTSDYTRALRAEQVWQAGVKGQGVTVAVIDTGITPSADISGRLVTVENGLSGTAPCKNLSGQPTCADQYGHGTFVGGIIAGDGASSSGTYSGVAPRANLLAVKVAGPDGSTDVSNVLAAIQWVVSFKNTYDIRVLNLSLSTNSTQTYRTDPFNYAVERAWDAGIVVVVSASNRGPNPQTVSKPADDPLVISVGALDDRGTAGIGDDELPDFSSRGPTIADGLAKPDLVAPGAHLMSLRSPGSTVDEQFPESTYGAYRRGSGTSFAAAATSGVVALMLARNPAMTPNQVKHALVDSARRVQASTDPMAVGAGEIDAAAAALAPPAGAANAGVVRSNGTGLLDSSRGQVAVQTATLPAIRVNGLLTAQLLLWDPTGFLLGWNPLSWYVSTWAISPWLPLTWTSDDWGGRNWGGGDWQSAAWDGESRPRDYGSPGDGSLWYGAWG